MYDTEDEVQRAYDIMKKGSDCASFFLHFNS